GAQPRTDRRQSDNRRHRVLGAVGHRAIDRSLLPRADLTSPMIVGRSPFLACEERRIYFKASRIFRVVSSASPSLYDRCGMSFKPSPLKRGITWTCGWGTTCPACSRLFMPIFTPSAPDFSIAIATLRTVFA